MHAESTMRQFRILAFIIPALALAGCVGEGDGPESIAGTPVTPLPFIPPGFCDPINFEILCPAPNIVNFNGGATTIIDNPDKSGINRSDSVAQMQKFADEVFGGTKFELAAPINFANGEVYKVKVWSSRQVPVTFKLEETGNSSGGREIALDHTGSGMWEELCFDFTGQTATIPNPPVLAVTIIFDLGVLGQASSNPDDWTFFYDDITQVSSCIDDPGGEPDPGLLASFDEATPPAVTPFGGASTGIEPGPAGGDGNALRLTRDGGEVFAGAWVAVAEIPNDAGDQTISALVYSPTAGIPFVAKVEYGDNMGTGDVPANESVVEGWQTLTWTFTNLEPGNVYNRFTILPNLGFVDTATNYYIDNIRLEGVGADTVLTNFDEATPPAVTEFGGASVGIEFGPAGGDGLSLRITRDGGEVFAGAWVAVAEIPNDAGEQTISALVYSPVAGVPMVTKVEYGDNMGTGDVPANEAVVVGWQTLTWTYTNLAPGNVYNRFTMLPNLGAVDTATNYYFDNITLLDSGGGGPSGTLITDFEEVTPPAVTEFGGASVGVEFGPAGGDGLALRLTRDGGEVFAGAWVAIPEIPNDAGDQTISAFVYSPTAGIPFVTKAEFGDNMGTGDVAANEAVVVGWQTLTWTYTNLTPGNAYNRFTILPNLGFVDTATNYYIDNITLLDSGGGGGGGGGGGTGSFTNGDFETGDLTGWTLFQFPDGVGSITADSSMQGGQAGTVGRLVAAGSALSANDVVISQEALAAGTIMPGDTISVSFDLYGTPLPPGGVVFVEVIFLNAAGEDEGGRNFLNGDPTPYDPTNTWTTYSGTVIAGTGFVGGPWDVSGGVTLSLKASCGAGNGCAVDASFDNVTFTIN